MFFQRRYANNWEEHENIVINYEGNRSQNHFAPIIIRNKTKLKNRK